jgi:hypothetical protein
MQCFGNDSLFLVTRLCACYIFRPPTQSKLIHFCKSLFPKTLRRKAGGPLDPPRASKNILIATCHHPVSNPYRTDHPTTANRLLTARCPPGHRCTWRELCAQLSDVKRIYGKRTRNYLGNSYPIRAWFAPPAIRMDRMSICRLQCEMHLRPLGLTGKGKSFRFI